MKNLILILFIILFISCGEKKNTPEYVAKRYLQALKDKDWETAKKYSSKENLQSLDMMKMLGTDMGISEIKNLKCTVSGNSAVCDYCCVDSDFNCLDLRLDKGKWIVVSLKAGCNFRRSVPEQQMQEPKEANVLSKGDYYFEFDELIHYQLIDNSIIRALYEKDMNHLSKQDQIIYDMYSADYPKSLKDPYLTIIEKMGYEKVNVDTSKFPAIKEIFREKKHREKVETLCVPEYNDLLVFKKKNKTIGFAKVCFGCMMHHILGTKSNTEEFGQTGDYERLRILLRK